MFPAFMLLLGFCCVAHLYVRSSIELFVNRESSIVSRELLFIHVSFGSQRLAESAARLTSHVSRLTIHSPLTTHQ